MHSTTNFDDLEIYVWEGKADIADRVERCMASLDVAVVRADGFSLPLEMPPSNAAIAVISVTVIDNGVVRFKAPESGFGMPVIWVASSLRERDASGTFPPEYSHILPFDFTGAELRGMVIKLVQQMRASQIEQQAADEFIAVSETMQALLAEVDTFADCENSVLLYGETGAGKERVAQRLHTGNRRYGQGPFVAVNCGAIPDGLFESLFFGHAKGAFTGAVQSHKGYFEQAQGGTLFLDEIGDLPPYQQVKLLRVLEDGAVMRIGATTPVRLDFRLVAATNRPLREMVAAGDFRADLFFRLAVVELRVPALEERGETDKIAIFKAMVARVVGEQRLAEVGEVPFWVLEAVAAMSFPGNVRELRNLAERVGVVVRQTGRWEDNPMVQRVLALARTAGSAAPLELPARRNWNPEERNRIIAALELHQWRRQETAQYLGISRKVLWEKMRKYQIEEGEPEVPVHGK